MFVIASSSLVALFFAFLASRDKFKFGLEVGFFIVTVVAAVRYQYGNDYKTYETLFNSITANDFDLIRVLGKEIFKESGWVIINYIFKPFGFFSLVIALSVFQNCIVYNFLKTNLPKELWVFGVFIYLFNCNLFLLNLSMMRQALAETLVLLAWPFIQSKQKYKIALACAIIYIASTIHTSAILIFPCVLLFLVNKDNVKKFALVFLSLLVIFTIKPNLVNAVLQSFSSIENVDLAIRLYGKSSAVVSYGFGFLLLYMPFFISIYFAFFDDSIKENDLRIILMSLICLLVAPFIQIMPMIGRLTYYFLQFSIVSIPIVYKRIKAPFGWYFGMYYVFIMYYTYMSFFTDPVWVECFYNYRTIFELIELF